MGESKWCGSMAWQHYAAKHPHQSVEDGQPFEMYGSQGSKAHAESGHGCACSVAL